MAKKKTGLGKGLGALIKEKARPSATNTGDAAATRTLPVDDIRVNRYQPRTEFDEDKLKELVESIKVHGVIQPLTVRKDAEGAFELIAGERRLRAAREANLKEVPVHVIEADDQTALAIALIENLQRDDLNPIEEALGYQRLADEFKLTQEKIAKRVGKGRTTIANALRLLSLPELCQGYLSEGKISAGHAKAMLGLKSGAEREDLARRIDSEGLSVRQTEQIVGGKEPETPPETETKDTGTPTLPDTQIDNLTNQLRQHFGTKVKLTPPKDFADGKQSQGKVVIEYYNHEDLQRLLDLFGMK